MSLIEHGCEHVAIYKEQEGTDFYRTVHAYFVVCSEENARNYKVSNFFCHICDKSMQRLHACLCCVFFTCIDHIETHFDESKHNLYMELTFGNVLCLDCGDYVYDPDLENIVKLNEITAFQQNKRAVTWDLWEPTPLERQLLRHHSKPICMTAHSNIGLRGLLNLGATCFMNCIVQVLMHTPLLRDYFLAEQHDCKFSTDACLVCEFSRLFQEFYRGDSEPLALHNLLYLIWTNDRSLAGYTEKDAHEFFLATLDVLHKHCLISLPAMDVSVGKPSQCTCIIDRIFTGGLQSDVVCQMCKGVSTTIEPISVISLELTSTQLGITLSSSLTDCLEHYTRTEHLGTYVHCSNCESYQQSTKQLTVKTLPLVLSLHLKRAEHSNKLDKKISNFISFPEMLNMTPYMSQSNSEDNNIATDNRYSLFAVINHKGDTIDTGHYIAYVRQHNDCWYKCNDDSITKANLTEVLESEGYLLFYHKHILEYE